MNLILRLRYSILALLAGFVGFSQTTLNTTIGSTGYTGTNSSGTNSFITFVVANNSGGDIILTDVGNWTQSSDNGATVTLLATSTALSGAVGTVTPPGTIPTGWTVVTSTSQAVGSASLAVNPLLNNINFLIPSGTTYRFALHTTATNRYSGTGVGTCTPNTFTSAGVSLHVGDYQINGSYVGYASSNNPRFFTGSVSFIPAGPCINPPFVGTATATNPTPCAGQIFGLGLDTATFGTGQTYQWLISSDNITYAPIAGATTASYNTSQVSPNYYKCVVTCGVSDTSAPVYVYSGPAILPLAENFTGATGNTTNPATPGCWAYYESPGHAGYGYTQSSTLSRSAPNRWYFYNSSNITDSLMLISPELSGLTAGNKQVTFWMTSGTASYGNEIVVGTVSGPSGAGFVALDTAVVPAGTGWTEFIIDVTAANGYNGTHNRIAFAYKNGTTFRSAYLDDILIDDIPLCPKPTFLNATSITSTQATLSWQSTNNSFTVEWGPCGYVQGTGSSGIATTNSIVATGLTPATCYDYYVQSNCGVNGTSVWSGPYTFTTAYAPPYLEPINSYAPPTNPSGWVEAQGNIANPTVFTSTSSGWSQDGFLNSGTIGAAREIMSGTVDDEWTFSPPIDLGAGPTTYQLEYDIATTTSGGTGAPTWGADDSVMVVISTDGGATWNRTNALRVYSTANQPTNTLLHEVVDLTGYTGVVRFGFYVESTVTNASSDVFIDNIEVRVPPSCPEPFAIIFSAIGQDSAVVSWNAPGNFNLEWGPAGFVQGTGATATVVNDSTYVLTGLNPSTTYEFYIQANCGGGLLSLWAGPTSFTTLCGTETSPYSMDFEMLPNGWSQDLPNCWTSKTGASSTGLRWEAEDATGANENSTNTGPHFDHTTPAAAGGVYMYLETSSGIANDTATLITPTINLTGLTSPYVQFFYHMYGATMGTMELLVQGPSGSWDLLWTLTGEQQALGSDPFLEGGAVLNNYANQIVRFKFRGSRGTSFTGDMAVDDFGVMELPYCGWVNSGASFTNITGSGATMNWSGIGTSFNIEWGPQGFTQGSGTAGTVVNNINPPYTFTGLTSLTTYDVYIQANCSNGSTTSWVGPISFTTVCPAALSGTYTVGGTPGPNNFPNMDTLSTALNGCGISGPVTIQVAGSAVGDLIINNVPGASATNTITLDGLGTGVLTGSTTAPYVVVINNVDHVTLQNITLVGSSLFVNESGVLITGDADSTMINNVTVVVDSTTTSSVINGIVVSNSLTSATTSGSTADYLTVQNSTVIGGYRGISVYGQTTTVFPRNTGARFLNNTIRQQYYYGIYSYTHSNGEIRGNTISDIRYTSFGYGIYFAYGESFTIAENNVVAPYYALYLLQTNNTTPAPPANSDVVNNMFVSTGNAAAYFSTGNMVNLYHNSFRGVYGIRLFTATGMNHRNNIFYGVSNYAWESSVATTASDVVNYNLYYSGGANAFKDGTPTYATLALWQAANTSLNVNSLYGDPIFNSNTDLHLIGALANDAGTSLGITVDIDGDVRPAAGATSVDIGADEYTPLSNDLELVEIFGPVPGCGDSAVPVNIVVRNLGLNAITSFTASVGVTGATPATLNAAYSGNLAFGAIDTLAMGTFNVYGGGTVTLNGTVTLASDQNATNDLGSLGPINFIPFDPQAYPGGTFCPGDTGTLAAVTTLGASYGWYANPTDTVPLAVGDSFDFPVGAQATYYVGYYATGAQALTTLMTGGNSCGGGNMFQLDATNTIILDSLFVNSLTAAGTSMDVSVYYIAGGNYLTDATNQAAWTLHETVTTTAAGSTNATHVPFTTPLTIPAGSSYAIYVYFNASYTNGNGSNQVFSNPDMTISAGLGLCGLFTSTNNPRVFNGTLHYRAGNSCSTTKIPVTYGTLPAPTAAFSANGTNFVFNFDASGSTNATGYSWDFGDGNTGTGMTTSHTYAVNGSYTVTLVVTDSTCGTQDTATQVINLSVGLEEELINQTISLFPNPTSGKFNLQFAVEGIREVNLEIYNATGQVIWTDDLGKVAGLQEQTINLSNAPKGIYWLRVRTDRGQVVRRIALQ